MTKKSAVFWVVTPCNLVEVYRHFGGKYCLHLEVEKKTKQPAKEPCSQGHSAAFFPEDGINAFL
jgi:hypothetical protein